MATEIKTFKERPECAVPDCTNDAFIHVAGRWICGECCAKWSSAQSNEMFNQIVEVNKNE